MSDILQIERQKATSCRTGIPESTLEKLRLYGGGPPFVKLGARSIGYIVSDVDDWVKSRRRISTSDDGDLNGPS